MAGIGYRSYVAIGDSLSEGLGDFNFHERRDYAGWTDRLAGLLSLEAEPRQSFQYANLSLRGSKLNTIMGEQLERALKLKPELVTVMAGSNDFAATDLSNHEAALRSGLKRLLDAGCDVVVASTIRPAHLRLFRSLLPRAQRMSQLIQSVAAELNIPVLDIHAMEDFRSLAFWSEDMVHFSGHGHIRVANAAAKILGLKSRIAEASPQEMAAPDRGFIATMRWYLVHVIPFLKRRLKRTTSGAGMSSKHQDLIPYYGDWLSAQPLSQEHYAAAA